MLRTVAASFAICWAIASVARAAEEPIDFNREIRPILSAKCFACHGPDESSREGELRLDRFEDATRVHDGRQAIAPGKPTASELIKRIISKDPDEQMPPPKGNKTLSAGEIAKLSKWVEQGGRYDPHWAFQTPKRPALPAVRQQDWPRGAIDRFVLARIEANELTPSPQADATTLLRRVSLDLIGLAPTPEEAAAFLAEVEAASLDQAYAKLVDRLLASPHYGERWARRWLDLARYADTNGYEKDRNRSIWPYRDWVIKALNDDMPFDQFTLKQLAGDLGPQATDSDRVATGFHRNTMLNEEGGIDPLEFRFYAMTDRVATTGTAWLGLTIGCCQCHNHKYDPISQREYFQFMAFLNNADEPEMELADPAADERDRKNRKEADKLLAVLADKWKAETPEERTVAVENGFSAWLARTRPKAVRWSVLKPTSAKSNMPHLAIQPDGSVLASGDITKNDVYTLKFRNDLPGVRAIRLEALPDDSLPAHGPGLTYYEGTKGDFFLSEFKLSTGETPRKFSSATQSYTKNQFGNNPATAALALDGDLQTGWSVNGRQGERHEAVFVLAEPLPVGEFDLTLNFGRHFACSLGKLRIAVTDADKAEARDLPEEIEELLLVEDEKLTPEQRTKLREQFLLTAPELAEAAGRIRQLRKPSGRTTSLVLRERPAESPRATHIHKRGEFLQPTVAVSAGTPAVLPAFPAKVAADRAGLARWLTSPANPLTARVTVNRQWAALFGRGIVATTEDLGVQGAAPSNQPLLDWLAVEFVEQGWSLKKIHRQMVLSATYRQSSQVRPESLARDPENLLLSRAPRPRIEAEIIRDSVLRASGLLSSKRGGPGVRPPQPAGVTEVAYGSPKWDASGGEDRYRRSIYTFIKRTAPFAMFNTFDAPGGEACIARRNVSNTPLQALTLLNDVMFVEAAQALGKTTAALPGDDAARIRAIFQRVLTREPRPDEVARLQEFVVAQRERLTSGKLNAQQIAGGGPDGAVERAAWTTLARALFSLDEAVVRN